jgi:hypothetical protein
VKLQRRTAPTGPPQGRGHYSEDGRHWWDDDASRWFRTTGGEDRLEIEVEEEPEPTLRRLAGAVTRHEGRLRYRFVARGRSDDPRWPVYEIVSAPFAVEPLRATTPPPAGGDPWADSMIARLWELERTVVEHGWLPRGRRAHWWSSVYVRPTLDWEASPEESHP